MEGFIHDLNNIFQTLMEAGDLLSEDPAWQGVSAAILRSVERGKEISASLRVHQPMATVETVVHSARTLVEDSLALRRGPNVVFFCELQTGLVLDHSWAWERVLINLFTNSVRAMPDGGTIVVNARQDGDAMEIVVSDDGVGIDPAVMESLFEPNVSTRVGGGLGLYIVQSIVQQHQGEVRAANRPGRGAEFVITIPSKMSRARTAQA